MKNNAIVTISKSEKGPVGHIVYGDITKTESNPLNMNYWVECLLVRGMLGYAKEHEVAEALVHDPIITLELSTDAITMRAKDEEMSLTSHEPGEIAELVQLAMQLLRRKETLTLVELNAELQGLKVWANISSQKLPI